MRVLLTRPWGRAKAEAGPVWLPFGLTWHRAGKTGAVVSTRVLRALATEIAKLPRPVYVHCAQGHGRTGMLAAALLLHLGLASTTEEAIAQIRAVRPGVTLSRRQRAAVERLSLARSE